MTPSSLHRHVSAVLAGLLLAVLPASPATAAPDFVLDRTDEAGDVRLTKRDGLPTRKRRSIDLRRAWVFAVDEETYRFGVKIRKVARKRTHWNQQVEFLIEKDVDPYVRVSFTHKPNGPASAYSDETGLWCDIERVIRRPAKRILAVDVPAACMPGEGWKARVDTSTGRRGGKVWSRDHRRLGKVVHPA